MHAILLGYLKETASLAIMPHKNAFLTQFNLKRQ